MSRANDTQVGGDHYHTRGTDLPQHWDLAVMFAWDPFQYQITKYVMRWKDKHATFPERLTDLLKAKHFIEKYIEEAQHYDQQKVTLPPEVVRVLPRSQFDIDAEYNAQELARARFQPDGFRADGSCGYQCVACRQVVWAKSPLGAVAAHACHLAPTPASQAPPDGS